MNKQEIQEEAKKIFKEMKIADADNDIINILTKLERGEELEIDGEKALNNIKEYLTTKEKLRVVKEDIEFLQKLSKELNIQKIRRTDLGSTQLFKLTDKTKKDRYFITRKSAERYLENNSENFEVNEVSEIISNEEMELERLLDIVKRNF